MNVRDADSSSLRAAVYLRISRDPTGERAGVDRQRKECVALCKRRKWNVVAVHEDNDISAYSRKPRPGYKELLDDLRAGRVDILVAWHPDRFTRHMRELEDLIDVIEESGATVETVTAGSYDLSTPSGRLVARNLGAAARYESEHKSARIRSKARELAEAGKVGGGGTRPFGFHDHDPETKTCRCCTPGIASQQFGITLREDEAVEIKLAVRRILDNGWSFYAVTNDWNDRDILTPSGKAWTQSGMKRMLLSPRIAGLRQHKTKDGRGRTRVDAFPAVWPAIVSEEDHELLKKRGERVPHRKPAKYLLRGFVFTAGGEPMVARPRADRSRTYYAPGYRCLAEPLEAFVTAEMLTALERSPKVLARLTEQRDRPKDAKVFNELQEERGRLDRIHELYEEGAYNRARYESKRDESQRKITDLESRLGSNSTAPVTLPRSGAQLRTWWDHAIFDDRRRLLSLVFRRIVLKHPVGGRNFFDPNRVEPEWRL